MVILKQKSTNLSIAAFYILYQSLKFGKDFFGRII